VKLPGRSEIVVIGGGIAGLAAAWELRDLDVIVLEASNRMGGRLMSVDCDPYWLNFGGHVLSGADSATGRLLSATGVRAVDVPGCLTALAANGQVIADRRVESYPLRLRLSRSERIALIKAGARLRLAVAHYARATRPRAGENEFDRRARTLAFGDERSFSDYLGPVPPVVDQIFRATIRRSSGEPEAVAAGYGIGYFQLVWDRKGGLTRNIVGGSSRLPAAITGALGERAITGCRVCQVTSRDDNVLVRYRCAGQDHELQAAYAVVGTPAPITREIIRGLPPDTDAALGEVHFGSYVVGAFLTDERDTMPYDNIYAVATPGMSFNMFFNTANVLRPHSPRLPGGTLMVYSGATLAQRLSQHDDDEIGRIYRREIENIFPDLRGHIAQTHIHRWAHGLPHPHPGRSNIQPSLERPLGRLHLAGDYLGTTYVETACQTGIAAAHQIRAKLTGASEEPAARPAPQP
jgi:protoporphyrinogen/coproporphyrinogen III oxidase